MGEFKNLIESFVGLVNFPYDDEMVDEDIKNLLNGKKYAPKYRFAVKNILLQEKDNLAQTLDPDKFIYHMTFSEDLCDEFGEFDLEKAETYIAENFHFNNQEEKEDLRTALSEEVPINFAAGVVLSEINGEKTEIISFCGFVDNPMYSLYTDIHEFAHVLQRQKFYPNIMKKLEKSEDEDDRKFRSIVMRGYREIHANTFASAYMMAMAVKSAQENVINKVEKMLVQTSAYMSNALINSHLGAAYCDWGATKKVISEIKQNNADFLFKTDGEIDFLKLYDFSFSKVKQLEYTSQMLLTADEKEGEIIRKIKAKTKNKAEMIAEIEKIKGANRILNDFVEAQIAYDADKINPLQVFFSRLANHNVREKVLFDKSFEDLPNIKLYRELYKETNGK